MAGARPAFEGPAYRRAVRALDDAVQRLGRAGYSRVRRVDSLEALLRTSSGDREIRARMVKDGRIFGGTYALALSTARPVLPPSRGLSARGRGVVRMAGVSFRPRRGDAAGRRLAQLLEGDRYLLDCLAHVHFEKIRVEPDGTATIRHMGGSVVWVLFPPLVKAIPLVPEQATAVVRALEAFAAAGRGQ
jgi:hypothetical protein